MYPAWLTTFQQNQFEKFSARGLPTRAEENWKYTDVSSVELTHLSRLRERSTRALCAAGEGFNGGTISKEIICCSINNAITQHENLIQPYLLQEYDVQRSPFAVLNAAQITDGIFLYVPKNSSVEIPLHFLFNQPLENNVCSLRNIIVVEENSHVAFIEEYQNDAKNYFTNVVTQFHVKKNARVQHHKIQNENLTATHISNIFVQQEPDSSVELFSLSMGAKLAREDILVDLNARGAECHLRGLYLLNHDDQHHDHHLHINHAAEHGTSSMLYKGILDKKSRAVFNGKVHVHPHAQRISSHQANHNLLLSKYAEINTKPELEIYADDVKCAHGATIGELNEDALFYLRSRGMDKATAMQCMLSAFSGEVFDKISCAYIKKYIKQQAGYHEEL